MPPTSPRAAPPPRRPRPARDPRGPSFLALPQRRLEARRLVLEAEGPPHLLEGGDGGREVGHEPAGRLVWSGDAVPGSDRRLGAHDEIHVLSPLAFGAELPSGCAGPPFPPMMPQTAPAGGARSAGPT